MVATSSPLTRAPEIHQGFDAAALMDLKRRGFALIDGELLGDDSYDMYDELLNAGNWQLNPLTETQHTAAMKPENTALEQAFDTLDRHLSEKACFNIGSRATRSIRGLAIPAHTRLKTHKDNSEIIAVNRIIVPRARNVGDWLLRTWRLGIDEDTAVEVPADQNIRLSTDKTAIALFRAKMPLQRAKDATRTMPAHDITNESDYVRLSAGAFSLRD